MSTTFKKGTIAVFSIASLAMTACASSGGSSDRYGDVYDYESGNCSGQACATQTVTQGSRYGGAVQSDCGVQNVSSNCAPVVYQQQAPVVYQQQAPVYQAPVQPVYQQQAPVYTQQAPVECPVGTTPSNDGTCLTSSYSTTQTYTQTPSYNAQTTHSAPVDCPAGTTSQSDGTCLQGSSYSSTSTYTETPSYSSGTSYSGETVDCPAGTTSQSDGSCLQTGLQVEIFPTQTAPTQGYSSGTSYPTKSYLPIRK